MWDILQIIPGQYIKVLLAKIAILLVNFPMEH